MIDLFPNAWHVARREYLQRVRSRTFLIFTAVLAVVGLAIGLLPVGFRLLAGDEGTQIGVHASGDGVPANVADLMQGILTAGAGEGAEYRVVPIDDLEQGRERIGEGELDGVVSVERDPDGDLAFELLTDEGPTSQSLIAVRTAATQIAIGDRLERAGVDPSQAADIFAPTRFEVEPLDPDAATDPEEFYGPRYLIATVLVVLTFMAVITYGTWVATSVAEEKSSRVMELLITAANPRQLLAGKVLGTGAAGLSQYLTVALAAVVGLLLQGVIADRLLGPGEGANLEGLDLSVLLPFGLFFVPGFLLYCILYAGFGSMASRQEDVTQVTGPMLFIGMGGYFAAFIGINTPDAAWVQVLSLIPFFSPYLLPARYLLAGNVAPWEWLVAAGLMVLFLLVALWIAARIYSAGVLLYGQRPTFRSVWRAVRVAR